MLSFLTVTEIIITTGTIDGRPWTQRPFPYQRKCLEWLRTAWQELGSGDQAAVRRVLDGTGCEPLLAP